MYAQLASIHPGSRGGRDEGRDEFWGIAGVVAATTVLTLMFLVVCFSGDYFASLGSHVTQPKLISGKLATPALPPRRQIDI